MVMGSYLGIEKGCFVITDTHGHKERYALFEKEIGEVVLKSGNYVVVDVIPSAAFSLTGKIRKRQCFITKKDMKAAV